MTIETTLDHDHSSEQLQFHSVKDRNELSKPTATKPRVIFHGAAATNAGSKGAGSCSTGTTVETRCHDTAPGFARQERRRARVPTFRYSRQTTNPARLISSRVARKIRSESNGFGK